MKGRGMRRLGDEEILRVESSPKKKGISGASK